MAALRRFALFALASLLVPLAHAQQFRPPAVPLVTSDPYLSIWSEANQLTDDATRHWTHREHALVSMIRVDGRTYRLMGNKPGSVPALPQVELKVTPTRSLYTFANNQIAVQLTFMTPALPDRLSIYARPVTYLTWNVWARDGRRHEIMIYDSASSELAVNEPNQQCEWKLEHFGDLTSLRIGTTDQNFLRPEGDDMRIDWGYAYLVAATAQAAIGEDARLKDSFITNGAIETDEDPLQPRSPQEESPSMAIVFPLGQVGSERVSRTAMIGYDEIYSIEYFGTRLRPYWRRHGWGPEELFTAAARDYPELVDRCSSFDRHLMADAEKVGGAKYAQMIALAYRECVAACGLAADANGQPLFFTKEDTSNGDIATVDVIFPMDPIWVLLSPTLAKASLVSNFDYAGSDHWKFPNAPHDLGTYPRVFGRDDGGEGMPVEESGNMILLTDAIAHDEGNAEFASRYWKQLTQWANYLEKYGLDPEDQLCTDDFMGHLAHNANLSVKAILALAAYGDLCRYRGDATNAKRYMDMARADAAHWVQVADAGDHSLLAFDQPNTWSQKYNLVWDKILGLNVFPPSVAQKEIAFYKSRLLPWGFPLDSRTHLTKTDWSVWSATMAEDPADFEALTDPIWRYLDETSSRDPIADSYVTDDLGSSGMHARPVVGGLFIRMLSDPVIWHKWASRDHTRVGDWAPLPRTPKPPVVTEVVPTARTASLTWKYTLQDPNGGWTEPHFNDTLWLEGPAGLGTDGTPGITVRTKWDTDDIWVRRTFTMPSFSGNLKLLVYHDEDVEVYVNGVPAASEPGFVTSYSVLDIAPEARKLLVPGATVTIAAHCHQTVGGQGIDIGLGTAK